MVCRRHVERRNDEVQTKMNRSTKIMSRTRMLCGVAIFAGVAAFGYAYNDPLADYISDHFFNDGKTAIMQAQARETFKDMHAHAAVVAHVASVATVATK